MNVSDGSSILGYGQPRLPAVFVKSICVFVIYKTSMDVDYPAMNCTRLEAHGLKGWTGCDSEVLGGFEKRSMLVRWSRVSRRQES